MTIVSNESPRARSVKYASRCCAGLSKVYDMHTRGMTALLVIAMAVCMACDLTSASKLK